MLLLLLLGLHTVLSVRVGRVSNATFVTQMTSQAYVQTTCEECTCRALSVKAVGWNCLTGIGICQLISNYSVNDTGLRRTPDHVFYYLHAPWQWFPSIGTTMAPPTTTATGTSSQNYAYRTPRWYQTFAIVAGTGSAGSTAYRLDAPGGLAILPSSPVIFVADSNNHRIQNLTSPILVGYTVAGDASGVSGSASDQLFKPDDVAWSSATNALYIADTNNHRIVRVLPSSGSVYATVIAGTGASGSSLSELDSPSGVTVDTTGTYLYVADTNNDRVLRWNLTNITAAGTLVAGVTDVASAAAEHLDKPRGLVLNQQNTVLFIADTNNHRVQRWSLGSAVGATVGGSPSGTSGSTSTRLNKPAAVALDSLENLYVADTENNRVQLFTGNFLNATTIVDNSVLNKPLGVAIDSDMNLYVADTKNHRVLKYTILN